MLLYEERAGVDGGQLQMQMCCARWKVAVAVVGEIVIKVFNGRDPF